MFSLTFEVISDFKNLSVHLTSALDVKLFDKFRQTRNNIVFAYIEYNNYAKITTGHAETIEIEIRKIFSENIIKLIKSDFYPYLYIYEMTNSGCCVVSNLDATFNMPRFCTSLMMCFVKMLSLELNHLVTLKI